MDDAPHRIAHPAETGRASRFEVPGAYQTLNALNDMHFTEYRRYRRWLAAQVKDTGIAPPAPPYAFAILAIVRHAIRLPDLDNLYGGIKPLVDCLVTKQGSRHPDGLAFLVDDSPLRLMLDVRPRLVAHIRQARTEVEMLELDGNHPAMLARLVSMGLTPEAAASYADGVARRDDTATAPQAEGGGRPRAAAAPGDRITVAEYRDLVRERARRVARGRKRW